MKITNAVRLFMGLIAAVILLPAAGCATSGPDRSKPSTKPRHATRQPAPARPVPDHLALARELIDQGHYKVALVQLGQVDAKNPRISEALYLTGICRLETGDLKNAVKAFQQVIRRDDRFAPAFNSMGLSLAQRGEHERSLPYFRRALELDPAQAKVGNNLGCSLMQAGKPAEAERVFRDCLAIDPGLTTARNNLAVCLGLLGKDREAMRVLLEMYPEDVAKVNLRAIRRIRGKLVFDDQ
jgi:Flp pilus assembly protein TadD